MVEALSSFFTTEGTEGHRGGPDSLEARGSVHFAANSVFESTHVEVDQQPDFAPAQFEVGDQLRVMNRGQLIHRLQFHDHLVFYEQPLLCVPP